MQFINQIFKSWFKSGAPLEVSVCSFYCIYYTIHEHITMETVQIKTGLFKCNVYHLWWIIIDLRINNCLCINMISCELKISVLRIDSSKGHGMQSDAVITGSSILWYYIPHNSDWSRTYIRVNTQKRHSITHLKNRTMRCLLADFGENWPRYKTAHCIQKEMLEEVKSGYVVWYTQITGSSTVRPLGACELLSLKRTMLNLKKFWR